MVSFPYYCQFICRVIPPSIYKVTLIDPFLQLCVLHIAGILISFILTAATLLEYYSIRNQHFLEMFQKACSLPLHASFTDEYLCWAALCVLLIKKDAFITEPHVGANVAVKFHPSAAAAPGCSDLGCAVIYRDQQLVQRRCAGSFACSVWPWITRSPCTHVDEPGDTALRGCHVIIIRMEVRAQ